ncbi:MAG: CvpA family protein, partial [Clostridia bacterium]|nr:CvpA family protein [Clostridia bacterium]
MEFDIADHLVDIILAVIFFGCASTGLAKGLVDMLTSAVSAIIAFIMAKIYAPGIAGKVYTAFVEQQLVKQTAKELEKLTASGQEALTAALPDTIVSAASKAGFNIESMLSES